MEEGFGATEDLCGRGGIRISQRPLGLHLWSHTTPSSQWRKFIPKTKNQSLKGTKPTTKKRSVFIPLKIWIVFKDLLFRHIVRRHLVFNSHNPHAWALRVVWATGDSWPSECSRSAWPGTLNEADSFCQWFKHWIMETCLFFSSLLEKINGGDFCKSPVFDTGLCTFSLCEPVSLSGYKNSQKITDFLFQTG